jgi:fasciclin 1
VPRDKAWKSLENEWPSVYKKLFMPEFSYHVSAFSQSAVNFSYRIIIPSPQANSILERHLIVSDRIFTMNELRNMSAGSDLILNTVRDQLKIRIMEHDKRKFSHYYLSRLTFLAQETLFRF